MTATNLGDYHRPEPREDEDSAFLPSDSVVPCPHCGRELEGHRLDTTVCFQTVSASAVIRPNGGNCVDLSIESDEQCLYVDWHELSSTCCPHCDQDIEADGDYAEGYDLSDWADNY